MENPILNKNRNWYGNFISVAVLVIYIAARNIDAFLHKQFPQYTFIIADCAIVFFLFLILSLIWYTLYHSNKDT